MRVRRVSQGVYLKQLNATSGQMVGGSFPVFTGKRRMRGAGLGSVGRVIASFAKNTIKPIGKRLGSAVLKSAKKSLPKLAAKHGISLITGKKPKAVLKSAFRELGTEAIGTTRKAIEAELGLGPAKKKKAVKKKKKKTVAKKKTSGMKMARAGF